MRNPCGMVADTGNEESIEYAKSLVERWCRPWMHERVSWGQRDSGMLQSRMEFQRGGSSETARDVTGGTSPFWYLE